MRLFIAILLTLVVPQQEIARRISLDFTKTLDDILPSIQKYYPNVDSAMIANWEQSNALEYQIIDGEKRYYKYAAQNLMRIDSTARELKLSLDGPEKAGRILIIQEHVRQILKQKRHTDALYLPQRWNFAYRLHLPTRMTNDTIKAWLPFANTTIKRQGNAQLIYSNHPATIFNDTPHACAYMEAQDNKFEVVFSFTTHAEYHPLPKKFRHQPVDRNDERFAPYLREKAPHCLFTEPVIQLTKEIVGSETRPYYQARLLFEHLRKRYPWASAREYSTIAQIPEYVINSGHGDCGQITLLFISACRYLGIPARWQSGFSLHPGYANLHDWAEIYIENLGWIPVDPSYGVQEWGETEAERYFYFGGIDAYRLIINTDWGAELTPAKQFERSENVDFQRGECESSTRNLYFDEWRYDFNVWQ